MKELLGNASMVIKSWSLEHAPTNLAYKPGYKSGFGFAFASFFQGWHDIF